MKTVELETVHEKDGSNISSAEKVKFDPFITPGVSGTGDQLQRHLSRSELEECLVRGPFGSAAPAVHERGKPDSRTDVAGRVPWTCCPSVAAPAYRAVSPFEVFMLTFSSSSCECRPCRRKRPWR